MTNPRGRFGVHGGQYMPETLMNAVIELGEAYERFKDDPAFKRELATLFNEYAERPSRLYYAERMTRELGGAKIYLKREDLNHTGAHKINNVLGQALLAKKMGKTRLIAETGAGQHGVATATAAALMDMECVVFMGKLDCERQALNVYKMRLLGADVVPVTTGTATLKDAVSAAMREWTSRIDDTHYCLGSVMGPHPFPTIVRDFQAVISQEIKNQMMEREGRLPDVVMACVRAMVAAGADLVELGIPFSDPTAEGPVIQDANERALAAGTTTDKVFDLVRDLRQDITVPLVFMTYANVVFSYGAERFISSCAEVGIDGLILPDVPYEEKDDFAPLCARYDLDLVSMIAPTSENRIAAIAHEASGFVYVVSSLDVTGVRSEITTDIPSMVRVIRENTDVPAAVGFGISTPEQAAKMAAASDGAIVGSAIVKLIAQHGRNAADAVGAYVREMAAATHSA